MPNNRELYWPEIILQPDPILACVDCGPLPRLPLPTPLSKATKPTTVVLRSVAGFAEQTNAIG
jgi:hypothetical protein